jgi:holliday junction DNA helicase RuvA
MACAILGSLRVEKLHEAIHTENADLLATVPGVGKKTAARLIVELRGKLPTSGLPVASVGYGDHEAVEALRALGYTTAEANAAVSQVAATPGMTTEERILAALREIGQ